VQMLRCSPALSAWVPLPCCSPTDYLFQPDNFRDDPSKFGTPLDFREPSFLDNPRTPAAVKVTARRALLAVCTCSGSRLQNGQQRFPPSVGAKCHGARMPLCSQG
jgi:hypothetical protein